MPSIFSRLFGRKPARTVRNKPLRPRRPILEQLEDRVVPSVFGNFQIDGDLKASVNPSLNTYDWDNLNSITSTALPKLDTIQNDAFNSATDDQFVGGAKES